MLANLACTLLACVVIRLCPLAIRPPEAAVNWSGETVSLGDSRCATISTAQAGNGRIFNAPSRHVNCQRASTMTRAMTIPTLTFIPALAAFSQFLAKPPAFEVASVKPNTSGSLKQGKGRFRQAVESNFQTGL